MNYEDMQKQIDKLKEENELLKKVSNFTYKKFHKILFMINCIMFSGFVFSILLYYLDDSLAQTMPKRAAWIMGLALMTFAFMQKSWYDLIWGKKIVQQCAICKKIKHKGKYYDLREYETVDYEICGTCMSVILPQRYKDIILNHKEGVDRK